MHAKLLLDAERPKMIWGTYFFMYSKHEEVVLEILCPGVRGAASSPKVWAAALNLSPLSMSRLKNF
jgi:hypothetical protein